MRAVIFDLFETLVTEWNQPKYTLRDSAEALDMNYSAFRHEWEKLQEERYLGKIRGTLQAYEALIKNMEARRSLDMLIDSAQKRDAYKNKCFDVIDPTIIEMLSDLRKHHYKIGIISNCAAEEMAGLHTSGLEQYLDVIVLSCDVGMIKPDKKIYRHCLNLLNEEAADCFYVGTDIDDDLSGALQAGIKPLKALWYIKHFNHEYTANRAVSSFTEASELVPYIVNYQGKQ